MRKWALAVHVSERQVQRLKARYQGPRGWGPRGCAIACGAAPRLGLPPEALTARDMTAMSEM